MYTKRTQRFTNNNCTWSFYISLAAHIISASLIIYLFVKPEPTYTQRQLANSPKWWTYESSSETLHIHATNVHIGKTVHTDNQKSKRRRLMHSSGAKLFVNGIVQSESVDILSQILYHGTPLQNTLQGPKGDKGDTGLKGDVGVKGDTGLQGDIGLKGDTGPKGDDGDVGVKGDAGLQGDIGLKGDTGPKGDDGDVGVKGDTGLQGDIGLKGDTGPKGDDGDAGVKGDTGLQGDIGLKGDTGPKGDDGDTGKSGENEWWVYESGELRVNASELRVNASNIYFSNLHTDGDIIAHGKIVTDKNFIIAHGKIVTDKNFHLGHND